MRVALSNMALNTGSNSPADALITLRTSAVAVSRSSASSRSRRGRSDSLSARTVGALQRFGVAGLRRRDLADEPAVERGKAVAMGAAGRAKPKRAPVKKAARPVAPAVETVAVEVIEQAAPGVTTVTDAEETRQV